MKSKIVMNEMWLNLFYQYGHKSLGITYAYSRYYADNLIKIMNSILREMEVRE